MTGIFSLSVLCSPSAAASRRAALRLPSLFVLLAVGVLYNSPVRATITLDPTIDPLLQGYQTEGTGTYTPGNTLTIADDSTQDFRTFYKTFPEVAGAISVGIPFTIAPAGLSLSAGHTGVHFVLDEGIAGSEIRAMAVEVNHEKRMVLKQANGQSAGIPLNWISTNTLTLSKDANSNATISANGFSETVSFLDLPGGARASPNFAFGAFRGSATVVVDVDSIVPAPDPPVLSTSVSDVSFTTGLCGEVLDVGTTSASANLPPPPNNGFGSGTASATATGGAIGGHVEMNATGTSTNFAAQMGGCFDAEMTINDIMVSGPGTEVTTSLNIDVDGLVSTTGLFPIGRDFEVTVQLSGESPQGGTVSSPLVVFNTTDTVSTTLSTAPITVSTGQPLTASVTLHGQASVTPRGGLSSSIDADFLNTVSFTTGGGVLDLPEGFTANSIQGNIVDNLFVPIPEPSGLLLAIAGVWLFASASRFRHNRPAA